MLALAALAAAVSAPPPSPGPTGPSVQAVATVRIYAGVRLAFDGQSNSADTPAPRDALIQAGGTAQTVRLIEFQ